MTDYMSAGRPTIATWVGDLPEVIEQHRVGLVTRDEPDGLAAAMLELLADPARQAAMGQRARQAAEGDFSGSGIRRNWRASTGGC